MKFSKHVNKSCFPAELLGRDQGFGWQEPQNRQDLHEGTDNSRFHRFDFKEKHPLALMSICKKALVHPAELNWDEAFESRLVCGFSSTHYFHSQGGRHRS